MTEQQECVLITGATGKLGRQFALGFACLGWDVIVTTRGGHAADQLEAECRVHGRNGGRFLQVKADFTDPTVSQRVHHELKQHAIWPTVLVNNARNIDFLKPDLSGHLSREAWSGELTLAVVAPYELTMMLATAEQTRLERVINIASIYGVVAPNLRLYDEPHLQSPINYGVAKAALIHLTKELAVRLADRAIAVNAISYGGVRGRASEEFVERYGSLVPQKRMLNDSDVFGAVRFLASADCVGITGHNLIVDGGWTLW